ncbi:MAG: sigma-54-dependent Fis family transcriptional regulator [Paludibacteraceae bacterium]|nr:sigma-54-dependent Fis family transcriptional regulator [Paludibacteraceae bacterium]
MEQQELQAIKQRFSIIGNSPLINRDIEVAVQVARTDLSVLITGESGVGKEHFPQIIHHYSTRKHGPYFAVNCGAIPEGTIDSELFGHEKGAFTDAKAERKGYFEIANGGTLFLDEVGELPLQTQVRLLRVLETGEFIRMGASQVQKTNVRVVAATNLDMKRAISEGRFREDLYYRLNTVEIKVPALRERKGDIPLLFRKFVVDFSERYRMPAIRLTEEATELLKNYYWNGNVRQLKNVAEQISIIENTREITADTLRKYLPANEMHSGLALLGANTQNTRDTFMNERELLYKVLFDMKRDMTEMRQQLNGLLATTTAPAHRNTEMVVSKHTAYEPVEEVEDTIAHTPTPVRAEVVEEAVVADETALTTMEEIERESIRRALERNNGSRKMAANELHISERTLYRKIKEYQL